MTSHVCPDCQKDTIRRGVNAWVSRWRMPRLIDHLACGVQMMEACEAARRLGACESDVEEFTGAVHLGPDGTSGAKAVMSMTWVMRDGTKESGELMTGYGTTGREAMENLLESMDRAAVSFGFKPHGELCWGMTTAEPFLA